MPSRAIRTNVSRWFNFNMAICHLMPVCNCFFLQADNLERHIRTQQHILTQSILGKNVTTLEQGFSKGFCLEDMQLRIGMKLSKFIAHENLPFEYMKKLHHLAAGICREWESHYHNTSKFPATFPDKYIHADGCKGMLHTISDFELESLLADIRATQEKSGFCFMMDASTDISVTKMFCTLYFLHLSCWRNALRSISGTERLSERCTLSSLFHWT